MGGIRVDPAWRGELRVAIDGVLSGDLGPRIAADARRYCPVDTGRLRESIYHEMRGETLIVGASAPYALYVEEGTRPHEIWPRERKALMWPGAAHPYAEVDHPGTRPEPFLRPALYQHRELT